MNASPTMTYLKRQENQIQDVESDLMNHYLVFFRFLLCPSPSSAKGTIISRVWFFFILREYITGKDDNF